jgi:predicted amidohydrolase
MTGIRAACVIFLMAVVLPGAYAAEEQPISLIPNGDFQGEVQDDLPNGWTFKTARPSLAPRFSVASDSNRRCLYVSGNGNPDCMGWVAAHVQIERGKTYWFRARFRKSKSLDPLQHLLFVVAAYGGSQGMAEFHRLKDDRVEGESRICFAGEGKLDAEVRILCRLSADGEAWIESVSLTETTPLPPRWVRVACMHGPGSLDGYNLKTFSKVLDAAGKEKADLTLLPEYINGEETPEPVTGPSATLMSEKAKKYRMYVAGTIGREEPVTKRLYNSALLFDRDGKQIGCYDKIHLDGPEFHWEGVTPGEKVPVFETDFGKVGFMTCYDSGFGDVAELVALKGADILLFPNLGYDRGLLHARASDNAINIVTSSRGGGYGVWDVTGRDISAAAPGDGPNAFYRDVVQTKVADEGLFLVTLDLNAPATGGGTRMPVPRSKRHLSNQRTWLEDAIKQEKQRWWAD